MHPSCRRASDNLYVPVEQTTLLYKEGPELPRRPVASNQPLLSGALSPWTRRNDPEPAGGDEVSS